MAETQNQPKVDEPKPASKPKSDRKKTTPPTTHTQPHTYYGDIPVKHRPKS